MKVSWLWVFVFSALLVVIAVQKVAFAGSGDEVPQQVLPPAPHEEITAGVWREGKAVFSDIPLLSPF
ncbi:MAG: hypothetical protein KDD44_15475, partial [Bdellovibrionales bacterium]|nr:hypothetical protein [Bdellovibrionales bacterium]